MRPLGWRNRSAKLMSESTDCSVNSGTLYRLVSLSPLQWEPVRDFTNATWTWHTVTERNTQPVTAQDIGKVGYQANTDMYYRLTGINPAVWQAVPNPLSTSSPFELSTGAADADSYHDYFRLQIAFEDVWAELLDGGLEKTGKQLYAMWDSVMDSTLEKLNEDDRTKVFGSQTLDISDVDELKNFLENLKILLGLSAPPSQNAQDNSRAPVFVYDGSWKPSLDFELAKMMLDDGYIPGRTDWRPSWPVEEAMEKAGYKRPPMPAPPGPPEVIFPDLSKLLTELDKMLVETYRSTSSRQLR